MTPVLCRLCLRMVVRPVQTINGHLFCEACFLTKRRRTRQRCTLCVEDGISEEDDCFQLNMKDVHADHSVVYDIYKLPAHCRMCGIRAPYYIIKKFHIDQPCTDGQCFLSRAATKVWNWLKSLF